LQIQTRFQLLFESHAYFQSSDQPTSLLMTRSFSCSNSANDATVKAGAVFHPTGSKIIGFITVFISLTCSKAVKRWASLQMIKGCAGSTLDDIPQIVIMFPVVRSFRRAAL